tara:strand:+ start:181 stop:885 length:705 start_codon:yes stop_codon:yes gene_type:complete
MNLKNKVVLIIQARMCSTRLPGKVLMNIEGKPALQYMIERLQHFAKSNALVVAVSNNPKDREIIDLCNSLKVDTFIGDEDDVLSRFYNTAKYYEADTVVRLTGDCPFIDPELVDEAINLHLTSNVNYTSNCENRTYPDGMDVEVMSFETLEKAYRESNDEFSREHVTPYIKGIEDGGNLDRFKKNELIFKADFSHIRWTLDTQEDLNRIRNIAKDLPENFSWLEALSLITKKTL